MRSARRRSWPRNSRSPTRKSSTSPTTTSRRSRRAISKSRGRARRISSPSSPAASRRSKITSTPACSRSFESTVTSRRWRRSTSASVAVQKSASFFRPDRKGGFLNKTTPREKNFSFLFFRNSQNKEKHKKTKFGIRKPAGGGPKKSQ